MRVVFADTFHWMATTNPRDQWHGRAVQATRALGECQIVTTEEVLIEYLNGFSRTRHARAQAAATVRRAQSSASIEIVPQSNESFEAGLALYEQRLDQGYSLTDCISMQAMRARGIQEILTADEHFRQEGFILLIRR